MATIQYLIILIINIIGLGVLCFTGFLIYKNLMKKNRIELFRLELHAAQDNSIQDLLDRLIVEKIDEYRLLKIEPFEIGYINEDKQKEIVKEICTDILSNMSPSLYSRIGLIYNPKSINSLIIKKISLHIINLVVENNSNLDDNG